MGVEAHTCESMTRIEYIWAEPWLLVNIPDMRTDCRISASCHVSFVGFQHVAATLCSPSKLQLAWSAVPSSGFYISDHQSPHTKSRPENGTPKWTYHMIKSGFSLLIIRLQPECYTVFGLGTSRSSCFLRRIHGPFTIHEWCQLGPTNLQLFVGPMMMNNGILPDFFTSIADCPRPSKAPSVCWRPDGWWGKRLSHEPFKILVEYIGVQLVQPGMGFSAFDLKSWEHTHTHSYIYIYTYIYNWSDRVCYNVSESILGITINQPV